MRSESACKAMTSSSNKVRLLLYCCVKLLIYLTQQNTGKRPRKFREELPKATELMKQRDAPLNLEKDLGKTIIVSNATGRGPGQPGYFCEVCSRTCKDSVGYLDHINSRSRTFLQHSVLSCRSDRFPLSFICLFETPADLRRLGQTTRIARSTIEQVRARIAMLREKTKERSNAKAFDFDARLEEIRKQEDEAREAKRAEKKAARDARLIEAVVQGGGGGGGAEGADPEADAMAKMMGFGGFGTTKK